MLEQRVLKSSAPTLVSYPRVRPNQLAQAQPTGTPTVKVSTPQSQAPTAQNATIDSVSTTVTAAAAAGSREIAVATATFTRGRRYLVTFDGNTIVVESRNGGSTTTLRLVDPLPCDVPDDALVEGFAVTRTLTTTETSLVGEGAAIWTAQVDGANVQWSSLFRIVTRMPTALLTEGELLRAYPVISSMMPAGAVSLEDVLSSAWEHRVVPLLEAKKAFDEDVVSDVSLVPLHALACVRHLYDFDSRVDAGFRADIKSAWEEMVSTTFARVTYAERPQDQDPLIPRVPGAEQERGRMRLRL